MAEVQSANEEWKWPHAVICRSSREIARCKKIVHPTNRSILCNVPSCAIAAVKWRYALICRLSVKRCYAVICRLPGWLKTIRPLPPSKKMETMSRRTCARYCQIKAWANCRENVNYNQLSRLRDSPWAHQGEYILKPETIYFGATRQAHITENIF